MATTERHGVLITPEAAQAVLWYFGDPAGIQPGGFTESLLTTIAKADLENRVILRAAFPELVSAFIAGHREHDGIEMLRQVAGRKTCNGTVLS